MIMDSEGLFLWHFVENKEMHGIKSSNAISYFTTWLPKEKTILCRQIAIETLKCFCFVSFLFEQLTTYSIHS